MRQPLTCDRCGLWSTNLASPVSRFLSCSSPLPFHAYRKLWERKSCTCKFHRRCYRKLAHLNNKCTRSCIKKISVRGPNFGIPRARRVPRMGAGRSKREREILSPSASAEPIFSFHILLGIFEINQPISTNLSNCLTQTVT